MLFRSEGDEFEGPVELPGLDELDHEIGSDVAGTQDGAAHAVSPSRRSPCGW